MSDASTREPIWSVSRETKTYYFILFSLQVLIGLGLIFRETGALLATWERASPIVVTSAAVAIIATEGWRTTMVLADLLRERLERQREQRRAEGRAEEREKWAAWNARLLAAEENGQHFDEPPPTG